MALPEYGQKHIRELPLKNDINDTDSFAYDETTSEVAYRIQFRGIVETLLRRYVAGIDFQNIEGDNLARVLERLSVPHNPDDGVGLVLRTHTNETEAGLKTLSRKLIDARAHLITDMFMESMTTEEFQKLGQLLAGMINRESSGTADGILANRDLSNLTDEGKLNATKVHYYNLEQTSENIEIPRAALGKCVLISLNQDVSTITLPTSGIDPNALNQVIIIIRRNGFNIATTAFIANGYTLRGTGAAMPNFSASFTKDKAIEFFCEYDQFTQPDEPTWNYGYSKIGH